MNYLVAIFHKWNGGVNFYCSRLQVCGTFIVILSNNWVISLLLRKLSHELMDP